MFACLLAPHGMHAEACRLLFTGSIARSATRRYLIYSEIDYDVFAPQGRHVAPIGVKFGAEDGPLLYAEFHPNRCTG